MRRFLLARGLFSNESLNLISELQLWLSAFLGEYFDLLLNDRHFGEQLLVLCFLKGELILAIFQNQIVLRIFISLFLFVRLH